MQNLTKIDKNFISETDKFLNEFNEQRAFSTAQEKEVNKHRRIFLLRDNPDVSDEDEIVWD